MTANDKQPKAQIYMIQRIIHLEQQIKNMRKELDELKNSSKRERVLKEALEFYADKNNYDDDCAPRIPYYSNESLTQTHELDTGDIAREALAKLEGE